MTLSGPNHAGQNWSKTTFLVCDNKAHFRDMVQTALMGAGAKSVKHATTVEKAVEVLTRYGQEIDCVICDWDMAPMGGLELLRMIRARTLPKTAPRTAVVILSASADSRAVKAAMAMDVNGFAVAPLSFEKLVKTVAHALTRTWMLQQPNHYASVPGVDTSQPVELKPMTATPKPHDVGHGPAHAPVQTHAHTNGHLVGHSAASHGAGPRPAPAMAKPHPRRGEDLKNVHMCTLPEVRPGQVLARDLRDREGHLLLSAGAVLKSTLIDRLMNVADGHADSYHLWIGDAEDSHA